MFVPLQDVHKSWMSTLDKYIKATDSTDVDVDACTLCTLLRLRVMTLDEVKVCPGLCYFYSHFCIFILLFAKRVFNFARRIWIFEYEKMKNHCVTVNSFLPAELNFLLFSQYIEIKLVLIKIEIMKNFFFRLT